jgi:hypothetical protein
MLLVQLLYEGRQLGDPGEPMFKFQFEGRVLEILLFMEIGLFVLFRPLND